MLSSALKTALRGQLRHPVFTAINIVGLAVGLACSLLIFSWVRHELGFEDFNPRADRLYRLMAGDDEAPVPARVAGMMVEHMPGVEAVAQHTDSGLPLLTYQDRQGFHRVLLGDARLPELLDLSFVAGERATALTRSHTMVISERIARFYFGDLDPVGRTLRWDTSFDVEITGVFAPRTDTHFASELIISMPTLGTEPAYGPWHLDEWHPWSNALRCYVLLRPGVSARAFGDSLVAVAGRVGPEWLPERLRPEGQPLTLQPVTDIHLGTGGQAEGVRLLIVVGLFVLLVASVNFINLVTARSAGRVREIGIRKAAGARQGQLAAQFFVESALQVGLAAGLAVALAWALAPVYEALTGSAPELLASGSGLWLQAAGLGLVALLGAGYPAIVLARLHPTRVLRDAARTGSMGRFLRRRLLELQFALAILLSLGTLVVWHQLEHMRSSDLGFDKEQVLTYKTGYQGVAHLSLPMLEEMSRLPGVLGVAGNSDPPLFQPFMDWNRFQARVDGRDETVPVHGVLVDGGFVETLRLQLLAGRAPRPHLPNGEKEYLLNETAVVTLGLGSPDEAVGTRMRLGWQGNGPVVGVVRDFHYQTKHEPIGPLVLSSPAYDNRYAGGPYIESYNNYLIRVDAAALPDVLDRLAAVWTSYAPAFPFHYEFLDEQFGRRHRAEALLSNLLICFAGTALFLTGLGVFAMAAHTAQQRTQEIGVRKVLGSTRGRLLVTLGGEFARAFAVAVAVAVPAGLLATRAWLAGYPYHIEVGVGLLLLAGGAVVVTAALAMAHQVLRAARLDPVDALRYE